MRPSALALVAMAGALAGGGIWLVPAHSEAQAALVVGGAQANYGFRDVMAVTPEEFRLPVRSGGGVNVRNLGIGFDCIGWVTQRPDFILRIAAGAGAGTVRLHVAASEDTSLVVNTAVGTWRCNDDADGTLDPTVVLQGAAPGRYDVWVGAVHARRVADAVLSVRVEP